MSRLCPWCCETIPRGGEGAESCPLCSQALRAEDGSELSPLDLRYGGLKGAQEVRFRELLTYGTPVALILGLLVPLTNLAAAAVIPLMVAGHLIAVRIMLIRDTRKYFGPARSIFSRWMTRLVFLWGGGIGYGFALIPVIGAVLAAATFAGLTWFIHNYTLWSLWREKSGRSLGVWEKATLTVLVLLTLTALAGIVAAALLVGWSVSALLEAAQ